MPLRAHIKELLSTRRNKLPTSYGNSTPGPSIPQTRDDTAVAATKSDTTPISEGPSDKRTTIHPSFIAVDSDPEESRKTAITALDLAIDISLLLREAAEASSLLVPLKVFSTTVEKILRSIRERLAIDIALGSLSGHLESHCQFIKEEMKVIKARETKNLPISPPDSRFLAALKAYLCTLEDVRIEIESRNSQTQETSPDIIPQLEERLDKGFKELMCQVHNQILKLISQSSAHAVQLRLSQLLKDGINVPGERIKPLTPGTRRSLIERLDSWAKSIECSQPIFWLRDEAGTGKSALAAHMSRQWQKEGLLAARFFFDRNGGRNFHRLDRFCATLIRDMVNNHPLAQANYLEMLEGSPGVHMGPFSEVFHSLVVNVAQKVGQRLHRTLVFVIDALDECHEDEVKLLTSEILQAISASDSVRFLLTSRPTREVKETLDNVTSVDGKGVMLLDVKHGIAQRDQDIAIYVREILKEFSAGDQNTVIECAGGVFLWATLACQTLLRTISPSKLLVKFENNTPSRTMKMLYEAVLEAALPPSPSSQDIDLLKVVLQGVALTYSPVSIFSIRAFFPRHRDTKVQNEDFVQFFVENLGSIMKDGTPFLPIYILHPTFREFIEDQRQGAKFYINPPVGHHTIAATALALMTATLEPNMLELDDGNSPLSVWISYGSGDEPPPRLSLDTEAPLRYAVAFWASHASLAIGEDQELGRLIFEFLQSKFITWVEWCSAIQELPETIEGLRRLQRALQIQSISNANDTLERWCDECLRFLLLNGHVIERSGLQAWMSALVFTPQNSLVYQKYSQMSIRPLPRLLTRYVNTSSNCSRVLWDNKQRLDHVFFSPDGKRFLAFGLTTRLWNSKSLRTIKELKNGLIEDESDTVLMQAAAFSSDGCLIASDGDGRIHLWDGFTAVFREMLPRRHKSTIVHVAFALSNSIVVAVDNSHMILCWDVEPTKSRPRRSRVMHGPVHTAGVSALVPSPDQRLFATFSSDRTIIIWDPEAATIVGTPIVTGDAIRTGLFSRDGSQIFSGHNNGLVTIWDVKTRSLLHSLDCGSDSVHALAISSDGWMLAAGSDQIHLWDVESGKKICSPIPGEAFRLAFNYTGRRLVSASRHVRIHDIRFDSNIVKINSITLRGHSGLVFGIATSPSRGLVLSASDDGTLRVWDTDLLDESNPNELSDKIHSKVTSLALSNSGTRLISIGEQQNFQMWDFMTGSKIGELFKPPEGDSIEIKFSFSDSIWASAQSSHYNGNVLIWRYHVNNAPPIAHTLPCAQGGIRCMAFDQSNTYLAAAGEDHTLQLWALESHIRVASFKCPDIPLHVSISPDKQYLASSSLDGTLQIWNLETLQLVDTMNVFSTILRWNPSIHHIEFSPDGKTIAMRKNDSIHLFDVTHNLRCYAFYDHAEPDSRSIPSRLGPIFSSDGRYLFYWTYSFNLANILQDGSQAPVRMLPETVPRPSVRQISPLYIEPFDGYVHSNRWKEPLLVVPADVQITHWVSHENMVGFGSEDGRVFIIRFPEEYI